MSFMCLKDMIDMLMHTDCKTRMTYTHTHLL